MWDPLDKLQTKFLEFSFKPAGKLKHCCGVLKIYYSTFPIVFGVKKSSNKVHIIRSTHCTYCCGNTSWYYSKSCNL